MGGGAVLFYEPAWRDGRLTTAGRGVFAAIARGVLDGTLPREAEVQRIALAEHLDRMDAVLRAMSPATQREVAQLLLLLSAPPGRIAIAGLRDDWPVASVVQVQAALQDMRVSRVSLRRQAYHALRDLTHAAYFSGSSSWAQLGYPGPRKLD